MKRAIAPPVATFTSIGGRVFTIEYGEQQDRGKFTSWHIHYERKFAGLLFRSLTYGTTADGKPRWHASTRGLHWDRAADAPTGIGFDVAAFDTIEQVLMAWGRSADQILDWAEGKPVQSIYSKTGVFQRIRSST